MERYDIQIYFNNDNDCICANCRFCMSTDYLQMHLGTTVDLTDKSYDPQGDDIVAWSWKVTGPEGTVEYSSKDVTLDLSSSTEGDYTIQLAVQNEAGIGPRYIQSH